MWCPICGTKKVEKSPDSDDGDLFVAEGIDDNADPIDTAIVAYVCENHHTFYVDPYQGEVH